MSIASRIVGRLFKRSREPEPPKLTPEEQAYVDQLRDAVDQSRRLVRELSKVDRRTLEAWRDELERRDKKETE